MYRGGDQRYGRGLAFGALFSRRLGVTLAGDPPFSFAGSSFAAVLVLRYESQGNG